jgi:hypothetical protein
MRRLLTRAAAAVLSALLVSALTIGCSGDNKPSEAPKTPDSGKKTTKTGKGKLEPVAATGTGTLKGRVSLEGPEPDLAAMTKDVQAKMEANTQDGKFCLSGPKDEIDQQKWRIGQNKGVQNVFVWLQPPAGHYFKVDMDKKTWPDKVEMDQPHCAFKPHALVLFPSAYNPDKPSEPTPTGQKFIVKNSAPMNHNTAWKGGEANQGDNKIISSGKDLPVDLQPDPDPVMIHCDIHKWMDAVVRVFDHPYATVTDKDGNYEIKNVPAGAEVSIVVWHEEGNYGNKGKDGDKQTLKAGDNTHDYTIKAK